MTPKAPERNADSAQKTAKILFLEAIAPLVTDLLYPSESDEPIEPVETYLTMTEPLTVSHIKDWLMLPPSDYVEEQPEADFWAPVTTIEAWFGGDEKATAAKFQALKTKLETALTDRQVFRVGNTEIDVYLLGKPAAGEPRVGLKTKVVET